MKELELKIEKEEKYLQELIEEYEKSTNEFTMKNLYNTITRIENYIKGLKDALKLINK